MRFKSTVLSGAIALGLAASPALAEKKIVVSGSGGGLAKVMTAIYDKPFTKATGIEIRRVASTNRVSLLAGMEKTGRVLWDVTELSGPEFPLSVAKGFVRALDWNLIDPDNRLPAIARDKYGVVAASFSTILAVRTDKLPKGKKMKSWADFWNVKTFPGPRALRNRPVENLEFALLADGVPTADLYKVLATKAGQDRAFKKLDQIKKHVVVWWKTGAQPIQLLSDGEVYYTSAFNGRVTKLAKSGTPAEIVWNGGALALAYYAIPKGAKNIKEAHAYLSALALDADRAAAFVKIVPYPGFAPGLYGKIPAAMGKVLPTHPDNVKVQFKLNVGFWVKNTEALQERWDAWLLK